MAKELSLKEIVESMLVQSNEISAMLNLETGKIEIITETMVDDSDFFLADEEEPDNYDEEMDLINHMDKNPEEYIPLPSQFDIHEYNIMEEFIRSLGDAKKAVKMWRLIKGGGAFRKFKDGIRKFSIEKQWYMFRDLRYKEIAIQWCERNQLAYIDDMPKD